MLAKSVSSGRLGADHLAPGGRFVWPVYVGKFREHPIKREGERRRSGTQGIIAWESTFLLSFLSL